MGKRVEGVQLARRAVCVAPLRALIGSRRVVAALVATLGACSGDGGGTSAPPALVITTAAALPEAMVGAAYDVSFAATGGSGSYAWEVATPPLPAGLTLEGVGRLHGTPTDTGTHAFSLRVVSGSATRTATFQLRVAPPPLQLLPATLPEATVGSPYVQFLDAVGGAGPVVWALASGTPPPGIALSAAGLLSGTPTALGSAAFRVRATRGALTAERDYTLLVAPAPLSIGTASLPAAKVGEAYSVQLDAIGGSGGNSWSVSAGALPGGLQLTAAGAVDGTPTVAGDFAFTARVVSGAQQATRALTLSVAPAGYPSAATVTMPANVFVPFLVQLARGGTVTWVFGSDAHNVIFAPAAGAPADINIVTNVSIARTFPTVGNFRYDCTIHPGMNGVIEVKP